VSQTVDTSPGDLSPRLSVVIEWANTRLHGWPRARLLLDTLERQWRDIVGGVRPALLAPGGRRFLDRLLPRAELVIVSGEAEGPDIDQALRERLSRHWDLVVQAAPGLEYYPLKIFGAELAHGNLLLFVDSDVLPEADWLAHLLGSFAEPGIDVVCGQTYVAPTDLVARAFALGWTYALRDDAGQLLQPRKFYANNIAFRAPVFRKTGFRSVGRRSRGASSLLRADLQALGIPIWENRMARVDHPPPRSVSHLVVRALAHGRDLYMQDSEARTMTGLGRAVGVAVARLRIGVSRTARHWRRVGLRRREVPAALGIIATYYGLFALGGVLTHVHPEGMARRFRV
jgi:hypothetical protein